VHCELLINENIEPQNGSQKEENTIIKTFVKPFVVKKIN